MEGAVEERQTFVDENVVTISLYGGKKRGLLENSRNLCQTNRKAKVSFTGQNGATQNYSPVIATGCGKRKKK